MLLKNKTAIITGATKGIGFAIAKAYLEHGAKVAILGAKFEEANNEKALSELKALFPKSNIILDAPDLLNSDEVQSSFEGILSVFGRVDILVNNAGIAAARGIYDADYSEFEKVVSLNMNALYVTTQAIARIMKPQGGGVVLNTSSIVSLYGQNSGVAYPASKFGVNGFTKSLARELGADNIRVNAVLPGIINTDKRRDIPQAALTPLINTIPLQRIGEPEDVANAFVFLASDMASYISGAMLNVDAGVVL